MCIIPKYLYLFQALPIKIPPSYFKQIQSLFTHFVWAHKKNPASPVPNYLYLINTVVWYCPMSGNTTRQFILVESLIGGPFGLQTLGASGTGPNKHTAEEWNYTSIQFPGLSAGLSHNMGLALTLDLRELPISPWPLILGIQNPTSLEL